MKERSLVAFTLLSQIAVGALWTLQALHCWANRQVGMAEASIPTERGLWVVVLTMMLGMLASAYHLGTPYKAWRVFTNLRSSWLSREILFAVLFASASTIFAILHWLNLGSARTVDVLGWGAALLGLSLITSMSRAYRLRTVPAWNTQATSASFFTTTLLLGGLVVGVLLALNPETPSALQRSWLQGIGLGAIVLIGMELAVTGLWVTGLAATPGTASRAAARITQRHPSVFRLRFVLAAMGMVAAGASMAPCGKGATAGTTISLAFVLVLASEVLDRLLFYEARVRYGL
jgi:anaerobic dimethyl sulfoxide reductase subunit C (anchor subunit)